MGTATRDQMVIRLCPNEEAGTLLGPRPPAALKEAAQTLADRDASELELAAQCGPTDLMLLHVLLRRLDVLGRLEHALLSADGRQRARLRPVGRGPVSVPVRLDPAVPVRLAPYVMIRAEGGGLLAQAPTGHCVLDLAPETAGLLGRLAGGVSPAEEPELLRLFAGAGLLEPAGTASPGGPLWDFHDLWSHARARGTRLSPQYGASYRGLEHGAAPPVTPDRRTGPRVRLRVPDLAAVAAADPPLTEVIEKRRSVRVHDDSRPITLDQLGELLYRTVRQRTVLHGEHGLDLSNRPYPSGGAIYEHEIYPLVTNVDGVEPGLWHYHAGDHALELVAEPSPAVRRLVEAARSMALMDAEPQVLLTITARFGRLSWKYETIAYSLTLKHVGVIYQTIYLVATAMGLSVCGLGGGDAGDFAAASGIDYLTEGSVGELVLGSRPSTL
ncbi:hypothetical protein GCM10010156_59740 [Planobispora rosea]|uniref:Nitroreductase domain-containing protein n=1 Tax=Planobispora rosea TaxID=35762 RepID=A0A8J3S796_PLARO|nr:SagB family peptide dehydrogenase [Planobispora rosea]GGS93513.1 hypothetical protein GCM10010156_59740 [Planobispora rosea]GIH87276.1 hypothetical protein Pro02_56840 [Planobispora rosea]